MSFYGADAQALRELADRFDAEAEELHRWQVTVRNRLRQPIWSGPRADRFRINWDAEHQRSLREAIGRLRDSAAALRRNADEQERTSSR